MDTSVSGKQCNKKGHSNGHHKSLYLATGHFRFVDISNEPFPDRIVHAVSKLDILKFLFICFVISSTELLLLREKLPLTLSFRCLLMRSSVIMTTCSVNLVKLKNTITLLSA